MLLNHIISVP